MKRIVALGIVLTLLFISMLTLTLNTQPAKASGTIYIRSWGDVDPPGAPIDQDGDLYTFTNNINDNIVVERDNIVLDGDGFTLQGSLIGINLTGRSGVTIRNMTINGFGCGIYLSSSFDNTISGTNITNVVGYGIMLSGSWRNTISGNNIITSGNNSIYLYMECDDNTISDNNLTDSIQSVLLVSSDDNIFSGNYIANSWDAVSLTSSSGNKFYHNTFAHPRGNGSRYVRVVTPGYPNYWDDGYPSGGNYWSNYTGVDENRNSHQNWPGSDGIGDTPHVIDGNYQDNYPLMNPWTPIRTSVTWKGQDRPVTTVSNTTISDMDIDITGQSITLSLTSSGQLGEKGYILVIFPMDGASPPTVFLNGTEITPPQLLINNNGTHYFIYFEFTFSSSYTIVVQFALPVGGIWVPVDKFSLLAPYIALISTIILAIAVTALFFKHKEKKQ